MLVLAGCASRGELTPRLPDMVPLTEAMVYSPTGGPPILGIVETVYANAKTQQISLATEARTAGQNMITVTSFIPKSRNGVEGGIDDVPFTQVNLTEEALAAWPDSGMGVSPYYVQNDYGPFGYAVGRPATGDTCIYAWQRIEPALKPSGAVERGAITIRLALCDRTRSEQSLLNVMYQLRFNGRVFDPGPAPVAIGGRSAPIVPQADGAFVPVIRVTPPPATPQRVPAAAPVTVAPIAPIAPVAPPVGAPIVPLPAGMGVPGAAPASSATPPRVVVPLPPGAGG